LTTWGYTDAGKHRKTIGNRERQKARGYAGDVVTEGVIRRNLREVLGSARPFRGAKRKERGKGRHVSGAGVGKVGTEATIKISHFSGDQTSGTLGQAGSNGKGGGTHVRLKF